MQDNFYFTDYLIVYFDVLGQRESLRRIKQIPIAEDEQKEFLDLVRDSLGKVLALRDGFSNFFNAAESYTPNTSLVPPEFRSEFIEAQKANYSFYGLSDAVVISVPLTTENENCTAMNVPHRSFSWCGNQGTPYLFLDIAMTLFLNQPYEYGKKIIKKGVSLTHLTK